MYLTMSGCANAVSLLLRSSAGPSERYRPSGGPPKCGQTNPGPEALEESFMSDTSLHRREVIVAPEKIVQVRFSAANNKLSTLCKFRGGNMKSISRSIIVLSLFAAPVIGWTEDHSFTNDEGESHHRFRVTSTTFSDGGTLPLSMVFNQCTPYPGGGNMSPELSWTNAPRDT